MEDIIKDYKKYLEEEHKEHTEQTTRDYVVNSSYHLQYDFEEERKFFEVPENMSDYEAEYYIMKKMVKIIMEGMGE